MRFLRLLLTHGISPVESGGQTWTMYDRLGRKLIHQAVIHGDVELVRWLFDAARLDVRPSKLMVAPGDSLLDVATYRRMYYRERGGNVERMIQLLLDYEPYSMRTFCACTLFRDAPPVKTWSGAMESSRKATELSKRTGRCGPLGIRPASPLIE